jgi:rod shape-determining protein MreD
MIKGPLKGEIFGFFCGLLKDSFSGGLFGVNAAAKAIIGYLAGNAKKKFYTEYLSSFMIIVAFFSLLNGCIVFLLQKIFVYNPPELSFSIIIFETLYNIAIAPIMLFILARGEVFEFQHLGETLKGLKDFIKFIKSKLIRTF